MGAAPSGSSAGGGVGNGGEGEGAPAAAARTAGGGGKQHMLRGGGKKPARRAGRRRRRARAERGGDGRERARYLRFHEMATARKLALATRGFELQNCFIEQLYDKAVTEKVGEGSGTRSSARSCRRRGWTAPTTTRGRRRRPTTARRRRPRRGAAQRRAPPLARRLGQSGGQLGSRGQGELRGEGEAHRFQLFEELPTGVQATAELRDVYDESTEAMAAKARARSTRR